MPETARNPRFQKIMEHFSDPLIIYSKWTGYLEGKYADPKVKEFIGNHRMHANPFCVSYKRRLMQLSIESNTPQQATGHGLACPFRPKGRGI